MRRFAIIHSAKPSEIEKRAIAILSELLLNINIEFPICIAEGEALPDGYTPIKLGYDRETLSSCEEYRISVKDEKINVFGFDGSGLLYGVVDLYAVYLNPIFYVEVTNNGRKRFDESLRDFERTSRPSVKERGIWTWGHVIYDWRGFIDNMVKLKMNSLIMWNDRVPFNIKEII